MAGEARWLLRNYRAHCARVQVLERMIAQAGREAMDDESLILDIVYRHPPLDGMPHASGYGSRTESAALRLGEARGKARAQAERMAHGWEMELKRLRLEIMRCEAILQVLTEEERALVIRHYQEGSTLEQIALSPLGSRATYPKSVSTLKRMLRRILEKAQTVIDLEARGC